MKQQHLYGAVFSLFLILVGCAQLGLQAPETFNERTAVALTAVTAVRTTATQLLTLKKISADDAQNVQMLANELRDGIDIARALHRVDQNGAEHKLQAVAAGLRSLQTYLATKGNP